MRSGQSLKGEFGSTVANREYMFLLAGKIIEDNLKENFCYFNTGLELGI